jgi:hypothetical protein
VDELPRIDALVESFFERLLTLANDHRIANAYIQLL